ncbi:IPT/TIG domain-containing protein [Terrabacter sp. BE26]|uniref:IPT/TIG domain-containing protein n=1 Tax=Terrabacter sp. BE26 TaxID=2898152 RepID=UPI0035BE660D
MDVAKLRRRSVPIIASLSALAIAGVAQLGGPLAAAAAASRPAATPVTAPAAAAPAVVTVADCPTGAAAGSGCISLAVTSARTVADNKSTSTPTFVQKGDPVGTYQWMINEDNTGDPGTDAAPLFDKCLPSRAPGGSTKPASPAPGDPTEPYADSCPWPSVRTTSGHAAIVAQGTEKDLAKATLLQGLKPGKYLISVTAPDFKIDGAHFSVVAGRQTAVAVAMQPLPLPLATIRIQVFNDNVPVDGTYEADAEQGLSNFTATLTDVLGLVSTDYYGNALCTVYVHDGAGRMTFGKDGKPVVDTAHSTGRCTSDRTGEIVIPNLGPNRYAATVAPPAGQAGWVQTTTLEGGHDHDIWIQEGDTGDDNEVVKGAEHVPATQFGFVRVKAMSVPRRNAPTGEIKGVVIAGLPYIGGQNGLDVPGGGWAGAKSGGPIAAPWVALSDLGGGDGAIYVGRGAANGSYDIKNVPDGSYQLTLWDDAQDYIIDSFNVEVSGGEVYDVGNHMLVGWFTHLKGTVFVDDNGNGKRDPGEAPVPQFALTVRERDNSLMDQATNTVTTNDQGVYDIKEVYPLSKWLVLEAFNTRYRTTGVTYKGDNEDTPTTIRGGLVDVSVLPVLGLGGTVDWGVEPYGATENGGIAATVSYDTTRNELDPADAVSESYQPGIPGVDMHVYATVPCPTTDPTAMANSCRQGKAIVPLSVPNPEYDANTNPGVPQTIPNPDPERGALVKGAEQQPSYQTELWAAPRGCTAKQWDGTPLTDQKALPESGPTANNLCVESPMMGVQTGPSDSTDGAAGQTVNGNYGFGSLPAGDYIVSADIPRDPVDGKPMYQVTKEEDVNVFDGDTYLPQENYPPNAAEAASSGPGTGNQATPPSQPPSSGAGIISPCAGALHTVKVSNQAFLDAGGSPFEGQDRPLCDSKLVTVRSGQTVAPNFNLFTPVPLPTHFWGLTINDLGLSLDKRSANYGEAQGLPHVPVGLYDWSGRLVDTVHTDFNGFYEALEPSTSTYNCPVPAGPCPNMYRFTGNDPGAPGNPNPDYDPAYRTISATFQGWPGLYTVTDTAPTQAAATVLAPGTTASNPARCDLGAANPQLLAVDHPYVRPTGTGRTVTVTGKGFGATRGTGSVTLTNTAGQAVPGVTVSSWSDTSISFTVPPLTTTTTPSTKGALKISITNGSKRSTYNGLTVWNLDATTAKSTSDNPQMVEVKPGTKYSTVQAALEFANPTTSQPYWLVVVWPGSPTTLNPRGEYNENLIVHHRVAIQGVGPGGFTTRPDGSQQWVPGSIIDGSGFSPDLPSGTAWIGLLSRLRYSGEADVPDAATITVLDDQGKPVIAAAPVAIDGFQITGGAQADFAGNVNVLTGGVKTPYGATGSLVTQGGGIYLHNNNQSTRITDNVIVGNSGSYGGGIRVGTPYTGDNRNYDTLIADNQVLNNGGTNLAGGIGLFTGSDGYKVQHNAICGNFSAEYGGAVTAFGYQANRRSGASGGTISGNTVWFNSSYDEGGAIMLAGELPATPTGLSPGTGPVTVDGNVIDANIASDDGGGIRLLQVAGSHVTKADPQWITISNNTVTNNVSAHEGGGVALDDAPFVKFVNNTVAGNMTTATAVTSDGQPAPAGLSTGPNSDQLMARLNSSGSNGFSTSQTAGQASFSNPVLLNDVFNDNRAGTFVGGYVYGIGGPLPDGTANTTDHWDMGVVGGPGLLHPIGSVIQTSTGADAGVQTKVTDTPGLVDPTPELTVTVLASRTFPGFREAAIVTALLPPRLRADYHLTGTGAAAHAVGPVSASATLGTAWTVTVTAPARDIDGDPRPTTPAPTTPTPIDAGSDQVRP